MKILPGDLADPRIVALLETHLTQCRAHTGACSAHALDLSGLAAPQIDFFAGFDGETLVAVGALKRMGEARGEIKSMHVAASRRGGGAGAEMLAHLVAHARGVGLKRLFLETGAWDFFHPARRLYRRHGFRDTGPYAGYAPDPNSVFMTLNLADSDAVLETRAAAPRDLPTVLTIYNQIVATSTAIYRDAPTTLDERAAWLSARQGAGFPVIVAERGGEVLGYASYGDFRGAFPGFRHTVEHSVHVGEGARGLGVGMALMGHLLDLAREAGLHVMLGAVDADNEASLRFHDKLGFERTGRLKEVGWKFGRWLDLVFVTKRL